LSSRKQTIQGADDAVIELSLTEAALIITYRAPNLSEGESVYLTLGTHREIGSAVLPFDRNNEGSTVFLPFKSDLLLVAVVKDGKLDCYQRKWEHWKWSERTAASGCLAKFHNGTLTFNLPRAALSASKSLDLLVYAKDLTENDAWGRLYGCSDKCAAAGWGDKYIPNYCEVSLDSTAAELSVPRSRLNANRSTVRIYQLFVRLFGNTNETRTPNGTLARNGVGKFNDINDAALKSLRKMGFTHIWLMGVLQQASGTDYSSIDQPPDDPDLLKGIAGSPYAIKDYFDVCPDYAEKPGQRLDEFKLLLARIHKHDMKALIDFVPNHVARSYDSDARPELNFGEKGNGGVGDDRSIFFSPQNNFFYLKPDGNGPPLRLPTCKDGQAISPTCKAVAAPCERRIFSENATDGHKPPLQKCDGFFDREKEHGKVSGNNKVSWAPDLDDWYETAKLNYGFDFTGSSKNVSEYPNALTPDKPIPDTWKKMDRVLEHWQAVGVDGFRCDMSHMVPPEFWNWVIAQARARQVDVVFIGEAYDNDPAKVPGLDPIISKLHGGISNVMFDLLNAGFDAVYDDQTYRVLKKIYEGPGWANDIDDARPDDFIFENSIRYAENHDEVRLAAKSQWGGVGKQAGPAICAILYGLSRGPIMLYNGQEVGEPGEGLEGFGNNDARTSIFDYWSMPELVKWVNRHKYDGERLSLEQRELRAFYSRLINLIGEPAFRDGICIPLNRANRDNPNYGRLPNEQASGHWLYSFLRHDLDSTQTFLIIVNLNPWESLKNVRIVLPDSAAQSIGLNGVVPGSKIHLTDRLAIGQPISVETTASEAIGAGVSIVDLPALTPIYFEMSI
jgi:glycosidase